MAASFRWILQMHKDVPRAAQFYSQGLDFTIDVCTLRWAELQTGPIKLVLMQAPTTLKLNRDIPRFYHSQYQTSTIQSKKLIALGAELDDPVKHEVHGKVAAMRCIDGHVVGLYEPAQDPAILRD